MMVFTPPLEVYKIIINRMVTLVRKRKAHSFQEEDL